MATSPGDIRTVRVDAARAYAAHVGFDLFSRGVPDTNGTLVSLGHAIASAVRHGGNAVVRRVLIVHDDALPVSMVEVLARSLRAASVEVSFFALHADESEKSLASVERILAAAISAKLERTDCFVALGGGIVGDLAGFAAGTYRRGVAWCNIPTTLLSMVDASIGGKTGCNLSGNGSLLKNMAGVFHDPALVICDTATLTTLPPRELVGGLAECVKHAMIERSVRGTESTDAASLWLRLEALAAEPRQGPIHPHPSTLVDLIADNLALKAHVVAADPFETAPDAEGGRALLNLGHTFGHALETMDGLVPVAPPNALPIAPTTTISTSTATASTRAAPMSHGEAVALGLVAACVAGEHLGTCTPSLTARVESMLASLLLPTRVENLSTRVDEAISRLRHDKKARAGSLRIIVPVADNAKDPEQIGLSRIFSNPSDAALRAAFERVCR